MLQKIVNILLQILIGILSSPITVPFAVVLCLVYSCFRLYGLTGWPRRKAEEKRRRKLVIIFELDPNASIEKVEKTKQCYELYEGGKRPWELLDFNIGVLSKKKWEEYVKSYPRLAGGQ